jgi:lysophospholipase L1-like esterase
LIDLLQSDYAVTNLAMYGDELEEMVLRAEYLPYLANGKVKYLLLSGGGNDVIGDSTLARCLNLFDPDHTNPNQAAYSINDEFVAALDRVERLYRRLSAQVRKMSPNCKIVVHGYDYAIPRPDGPYLGVPMQSRGLYPNGYEKLCNAIIALMIDRFNERLKRLPQQNVIYVNLRGTAKTERGWFDELHPTAATARKLAAKIKKVLN